ncbi:hypothetical protein F4806DRAFT_505359 [Annulohypoxylon nitens]|nr:hypothetical protein F4806DRAFT_505359 [Annulohypoxylon nitens]
MASDAENKEVLSLRKDLRFGLPPRNHCFVGREKYLRELHQLLVTNTPAPSALTNPACCIVTSRSGMGKTDLAVEFCYRNQDFFDCVIFLEGSSKSVLLKELQQLAEYLGIPGTTPANVVDMILDVFERSELPWLLVIDDVDPDITIPFPKTELGSILMTTRRVTIPERGHTITLEPLSEKKGALMLRKYLMWTQNARLSFAFKDEEFRQISRAVGNYPLYLQKVAWASVNYESSYHILQDLDTRDKLASLLRRGSPETTMCLSIINGITFLEIPKTSLRLLWIVAYLDGNFIADEFLISSDLETQIGCSNSLAMAETIQSLLERRLVSRKPGGLSINRDLQFDILRWLDDFTVLRDATFSSACHLVRAILPTTDAFQRVVSYANNRQGHNPVSHAMRLYENFRQTPGDKLAFLALAFTLCTAGQDCWTRLLRIKGNLLLKAALDIVRSLRSHTQTTFDISQPRLLFGPEDKSPRARRRAEALEGDICALLGAINCHCGIEGRHSSITYRRLALHIRLKHMRRMERTFSVTREAELQLQSSYSDLSIELLYLGDFEGADRVIEICRSHYEEWDPDKNTLLYEYAKYYYVKAFVYMALGDSDRALEASELSVDLLNEESHDTWLIAHHRFAKATMYFYGGRTVQSLEIHEALLSEISEHSLLADDIFYVESIYMVSALSYLTGDYQRTLDLCEALLDRGVENFPEEKARLQHILSLAYLKFGMIRDAKRMEDAAECFRHQHRSAVPNDILRAEIPLAIHDHFCAIHTRLTGQLASRMTRILSSLG